MSGHRHLLTVDVQQLQNLQLKIKLYLLVSESISSILDSSLESVMSQY